MRIRNKHFPFLVLTALLTGCNSPPAAAPSGDSVPAVTNDVVKRQDLTGYSFFDGKLVIPDSAQASAFSPYDTPVVSIMTGTGKYVERGEPIVKLTIPGADAAAAAAKADAHMAQADYSAQKGESSAPVQAAKQALADAQAAEKAARDTVANGGQADVEAATQVRVDAEAALADALRDQRQALQPTKEVAAQAEAAAQQAKADAAKGIVRAPISGTVVAMEAQPGLMAKSKQRLAMIVNFEAARVQGLVPAELKDIVIKGSHVIIAMNGASSDPLDGTVVDVTVAPPAAGQTAPGYLAVIEFDKPRSIVLPAVSVKRIGVKTGTVKDALVVPAGAIRTKDGKSTVSVQSGTTWVETPVETGISDGALVEVKSGLTEGAVVRVVTPPQESPKN